MVKCLKIVLGMSAVLVFWAGTSRVLAVPVQPSACHPANAQPLFDLQADLKDATQFYNLPYPSDLRLTASGHLDLTGFPIRRSIPALQQLQNVAQYRIGFPVTSVAYFRFNQPLAPQQAKQPLPTRPTAPILLMDIDPNSPERGRLFPIIAATPRPDAHFVPPYLLAVAPYPGIVLQPQRRYAYVVRCILPNANGGHLATSPVVKQLLEGIAPRTPRGEAARKLYHPLWETLARLGIDRHSVATATVFTTGDVVSELHRLSEQVRNHHRPEIESLQIDPVDGTKHPRFCELQGRIRLPQFQQGIPPFSSTGRFVFEKGALVSQGQASIPVAVTLPKQPMPQGGYPLLLYFHGSNGLSTQGVDLGPITIPGGTEAIGLGPAHVMAEAGFATVGSALPLNPERLPNSSFRAYLNPANLAAYPYTFQQGVIEQRLLLDALTQIKIAPSVVVGCVGLSLPPSETHFRLQTTSVMALGLSHGAHYAVMMAAIEPRIRAVVPAGSGGFWSFMATESLLSPIISMVLGTEQPLDFLHPALHLLETAWESADPIIYAPRMAQTPLPNQPVRSIYQPVGQGDTLFPESVFDAMSLASGIQQAGNVLWPSMQRSLARNRFDGLLPYPVTHNRRSNNGQPYTGVVVQFAGDGLADPHFILPQLDTVKYQYRCFFQTFQEVGSATVSDPQSMGTSCSNRLQP